MIYTSRLKPWCIAGFIVIVTLGVLYHSAYGWSGRMGIVGIVVPVNESVWEHLKLGLWSVITFSAFEYLSIGGSTNNYFFTKAIGVLVISLTITAIYYSYTSLLHRNILAVDISSYVVGALLCQYAVYRIFQLKHSRYLNKLGIAILISFCTIFAFFTYYPPKREIFRDSQTNSYGIPAESIEMSGESIH